MHRRLFASSGSAPKSADTDVRRRDAHPANKPLQQTNATPARSQVGSCRDAAGYARGSSRPWYTRRRPGRSLLNGRTLDRRSELSPGNPTRQLPVLRRTGWPAVVEVPTRPDKLQGVWEDIACRPWAGRRRNRDRDACQRRFHSRAPGTRGTGSDDHWRGIRLPIGDLGDNTTCRPARSY